MDAELKERLGMIVDAMDKTTGDGRDQESAVADCHEIVEAYPELFEKYQNATIEDCVQAVEAYRNAGLLGIEDLLLVETWLLHKFPPQEIGGRIGIPVTSEGMTP